MLTIKRTISGALLFSIAITQLYAENDFAEYQPQAFFSGSDNGVFYDLQAGELLKPFIDNNRTLYLEQNGDIFDEDTASIDDIAIQSLAQESYSFSKSKRLLGTKVYTDHLVAFYSGCTYKLKEKKLVPIHSSCGFHYRKNKNRSERIEWEHIVPAWHFGNQLRCWQNGGRSHCRSTNELFKQMEADMHNLVPAIGEINGDRSNFKYGIIEGEERLYGKPNMEIDFANKRAEPPENVQGDIARTYFYMAERYKLQISDQQQNMFIAWNNTDPVDEWERIKNQRVKELQGDENFYITNYKKLQQNDKITSDPSTDANDINNTLRDVLSFLYRYLPESIVEIILALLTLLVLWWRKAQAKKSNNPEPNRKTIDNSRSTDKSPQQFDKKAMSISELNNVDEQQYLQIKTQLTNKVLAIDNEGALVIEKSNNSPSQHWQLEKTNKTEGFVFIKHRISGQVLAVKDALQKDDAPIVLEDSKRRSNNHQEWKLVAAEDNENTCTVFIENRETGYVLDVSRKKTAEGSQVASFHRKTRGTENQQWQLFPADPS